MATQVTITVTLQDFDKSKLPAVTKDLGKYAGGSDIESRVERSEMSLMFETEMRGDETPDDLSVEIEKSVRNAHGGDRVVVTVDVA